MERLGNIKEGSISKSQFWTALEELNCDFLKTV